MDKNRPSAQRVYCWSLEIRVLLCLVWSALAAFFLFGLVAGIDYQINHPESRWPSMERLVTADRGPPCRCPSG
jgi:hypothetical protein